MASGLLTDHCNNYLYFAIIIELHIAIDRIEKRGSLRFTCLKVASMVMAGVQLSGQILA